MVKCVDEKCVFETESYEEATSCSRFPFFQLFKEKKPSIETILPWSIVKIAREEMSENESKIFDWVGDWVYMEDC